MNLFITQLAQAAETSGGCYVNGEPASCAQAGGIVAAVMIPMFLVFAVLSVFWIISLIHLIKHADVPNRAVWLILHFVGLGPLAGIIYFFAVKRPYDKKSTAAPATPAQ
jgi:hypothetical protein